MKKAQFRNFLILTILSFSIFNCCSVKQGITYYICVSGDDENNGKSLKKPWQTIDKVNSFDFSEGDKILFKAGEEFEGTIQLSVEDKGTEKNRVILSSYGDGTALINGGDKESLRIDSCDFLSVEKLELLGLGRKSGNKTDGFLLTNSNDLVINKIEVHGFQHSGLHVHKCNNATITEVYAHNNGFAGIHVTGSTMNDSVNYDNHNLYIGYCVAENNPGDPTVLQNHSGNGILASSVKKGIIEYCEAFNNGWDMPWDGNGPVGIWIWDCTDFTIQRCISHHNRTNPNAADGGGFDLDGGVSNSTIQYCISHNNEGAGFGLYEFGAAKPWENNTIRYNISHDDGIINGGSVGIWKNENRGVMKNCNIYNNTFYNSLEDGTSIWLYDNYPGFSFYNNVFVYRKSLLSGESEIKDEVFQGNLYWNLTGDESMEGYENLKTWATAKGKEFNKSIFVGVNANPEFYAPGVLDLTNPSKINRENLSGFIPKPGSPLIDKALNLTKLFNDNTSDLDITGQKIPVNELYDIGAIEYVEPN